MDALQSRSYASCQEGVEALINCMNSIGEEDSVIVELLEELYKLLHQAYSGEIDEKPLMEKLSQIMSCVSKELSLSRIEVAFISHKASMSDSLESIYLAAKEDPDCDAYWIPVPHIELSKDHEIATIHFEGEGHYGDELEITKWEKYDFEARRPDIVFTFNEYDDYNYMSVIHPDFFNRDLCKKTDMLIYVPYYVDVDGGTIDASCTNQGCMYARHTILSTEKMRERYVRTFEQTHGDEFGNPEEKFVALGSPKYDKVINTKREDCKLPQEWSDIIGEKKVITYISSITSFLETSDTYLEKLQDQLDIFKIREDVVLWWRPHPLIESAFKTMRLDKWQLYQEIVATYKDEGWGIFDDTTDLHRAVAWGDAFYGDWSSVLLLYRCVGKTAMISDSSASFERIKPELGDCRLDREPDSLVQFIDDVVSGNTVVKESQSTARNVINADGTAGKAIYEFAKRAVL